MLFAHDDTVTHVVMVRHGQSDFNAQKRFQGSLDEPQLTAKGRETAVMCGRYLSQIHFDVILCSPLRRTRQTVEGILSTYDSEKVRPPVSLDERLREVHLPGWEGLPMKSVAECYPTEYEIWRQRPEQLLLRDRSTTANGDLVEFSPLKDMEERASRFWDDMLIRRRGQSVLIVGHGAALSTMLSLALRVPVGGIHRVQQSNGGISCLEFGSDTGMYAHGLCINRTQHIGEVLPKMKEGHTGLRILLLSEGQPVGMCCDKLLPGTEVEVFYGEESRDKIADYLGSISDSLQTIAWVLPVGRLGTQVVGMLRLGGWQTHSFAVEQGGLSVLHYPRLGCEPVIQAMNIGLEQVA